jgi:hypothetical protein
MFLTAGLDLKLFALLRLLFTLTLVLIRTSILLKKIPTKETIPS